MVLGTGGTVMRVLRTAGSFFFQFVLVFLACLIVAQPILAERPPAGYARPPIHVKGNATSAPTGLSPSQVQKAYGFDKILNNRGGAGQTIAIVDAFDDPNIASDLPAFKSKFGIPSTDCNFQKIYA